MVVWLKEPPVAVGALSVQAIPQGRIRPERRNLRILEFGSKVMYSGFPPPAMIKRERVTFLAPRLRCRILKVRRSLEKGSTNLTGTSGHLQQDQRAADGVEQVGSLPVHRVRRVGHDLNARVRQRLTGHCLSRGYSRAARLSGRLARNRSVTPLTCTNGNPIDGLASRGLTLGNF